MGMDSDAAGDFGFAFNNVKFSDRLLRIEIVRGGCSSIVDWVRDCERRREEFKNQSHALDLATCEVESDLNKNSCENINNKHEEAMVTTKGESESGVEDENEHHMTNNPSVLRVKELHISSAVLAAKSPFFHKLFSNGMLESEKKHVTLKIDASEEDAVMEILKFMYSNSLTVTTTPALLDVLMAADKFEVASCMKYCSGLLLSMPMTLDSALLLLDLPSTVMMADSVKPLTNAAKQFLASRYKDISKSQLAEVMALPLVGIQAILASNDLVISSEDIVYEVALGWAKFHYSVVEERQEILGSHLARYIRFPHMTCRRLKKVLTSDDFKPCVASKLVLEALFFKLESLHHRRSLAAEQRHFVERAYKHRPIQTVELEVPRHQCIVYLDLKRSECAALYPSSRIFSQALHLGGQWFVLSAFCNMDQLNLFHCFGMLLGMPQKGSVSLTVDYEFSARSKPTEEFVVKYKGNYKFTGGESVGCRNMFAIPWGSFIAKDSPYFINDVLHLRAELWLRP